MPSQFAHREKVMKKATTASFEIDCQKTFTPLCPAELPVPEGEQIVDEINAQATFAAFRLGSKEAHSLQATFVDPPVGEIQWPVHAVPGTLGFESLDGLPPVSDYDFFVWKGVELDLHPYGSCYHDLAETVSTGVIEFLQAKGVDTVIVGGLAADYCVKTTVLQLLKVGFKVIVNLGACRGLTIETTQAAIAEMQQHGAVMVHNSSELKNANLVAA